MPPFRGLVSCCLMLAERSTGRIRRPGDPRTPCCEPVAEGFARAGGVGVVVGSGVGVVEGGCDLGDGRSHVVSSVTLFQK